MGRQRGLFDCLSRLIIGTGKLAGLRCFGDIHARSSKCVFMARSCTTKLAWPVLLIALAECTEIISSIHQRYASLLLSILNDHVLLSPYFPPFPFPPSFPFPPPPPPPFFFFPPPNISKCPAFSANALSVFPVNPAVYFCSIHTNRHQQSLSLSLSLFPPRFPPLFFF